MASLMRRRALEMRGREDVGGLHADHHEIVVAEVVRWPRRRRRAPNPWPGAAALRTDRVGCRRPARPDARSRRARRPSRPPLASTVPRRGTNTAGRSRRRRTRGHRRVDAAKHGTERIDQGRRLPTSRSGSVTAASDADKRVADQRRGTSRSACGGCRCACCCASTRRAPRAHSARRARAAPRGRGGSPGAPAPRRGRSGRRGRTPGACWAGAGRRSGTARGRPPRRGSPTTTRA